MISPPTTRRDRVHAELSEVLARLFKSLRTNLPLEVPGVGRVTHDQFGVLVHLSASGGCTMGELAAARSIALNSATALVDRLVQSGFVAREQGATDRRVVRVRATLEGIELVAGLRRRRDQYLRRMVGQLDEAELAAIQSALPALERLSKLSRAGRLPR